MTAHIWTRTRFHYEESDKGKPLPAWGSVRYPMCLTCGGHCIPAFDSLKARCPKCGEVEYAMVPEDKFDEAREEIRKKKPCQPPPLPSRNKRQQRRLLRAH